MLAFPAHRLHPPWAMALASAASQHGNAIAPHAPLVAASLPHLHFPREPGRMHTGTTELHSTALLHRWISSSQRGQ